MDFKTTKDIRVSQNLVDQIIGQEHGVEIIKKAAMQRRNVFLIGDPGTGKSMIGQALAELLPKEKLVDIIALPNPSDENLPLIRTVPKGQAKNLITQSRLQAMSSFKNQSIIMFVLVIVISLIPYYFWKTGKISDVIYAASMLSSMVLIVGLVLFINVGKKMALGKQNIEIPKLLVDNSNQKKAPFIDATGSHAGALLGDVLHDPLQSGGLGTPSYQRILSGMIHRANGGVLFIDELSTLSPRSQQELLTALQEKKYPITGQSERSSGAQTRSEPVPCDFTLVAAGNVETINHMHPALRSRIRGYGYEVYMNTTMPDTKENREKIAQFVAQEVIKDKKIPHFDKEAVEEIIQEARKKASMADKLTLRLRELGGLVRAAGDLALEQKAKFVTKKHVIEAKKLARTLEQQMADRYIENKKKYEVIITQGKRIGRVNGLAIIGTEGANSGIVLPIESEVTPGGKRTEFTATGKLGQIAKEAVKNVSAIILKYFGEDIKEKYDVFVQFLQTYEGVEGDSASIAVATAIISALKEVPVRQDTAMTGSLSVRGRVLAIGGVTSKIEAAIETGIKRVIIPRANERDVILSKERLRDIEIIPVDTLKEVLQSAIDWKGKEKILEKIK
jgi:Lon-like ATP-dependent protease